MVDETNVKFYPQTWLIVHEWTVFYEVQRITTGRLEHFGLVRDFMASKSAELRR